MNTKQELERAINLRNCLKDALNHSAILMRHYAKENKERNRGYTSRITDIITDTLNESQMLVDAARHRVRLEKMYGTPKRIK